VHLQAGTACALIHLTHAVSSSSSSSIREGVDAVIGKAINLFRMCYDAGGASLQFAITRALLSTLSLALTFHLSKSSFTGQQIIDSFFTRAASSLLTQLEAGSKKKKSKIHQRISQLQSPSLVRSI